MTWFKSFSDGKGGFNTFDWSLGDSLTYGIIYIGLLFVMGLLFIAILPILLLIVFCFCTPKGMRITSIVSIVLSTLFLINYSTGYAFWDGANCNEYVIEVNNSLATIHASLIFINIILIIIADNLHTQLNYTLGRQILFIVFIGLIIKFLWYPNLYDNVSDMRAKVKYGTELPKN